MKRKAFIRAIAFVLAIVFLVSGYHIYLILEERQAAKGVYENLNQFVQMLESGDAVFQDVENGVDRDVGADGTENKEDLTVFPAVDFESLKEINEQVVGWIYCEGNTINYPIVQGTDNSYYLKHLFNGEANSDGSIFLDSGNRSDFSDCHSIIYGHHMKSGAMFASLMEYKNQEYYQKHPEMLLMTLEGNYRVEIFAGYVADAEMDAWQIDFVSEEDFRAWIDRSISRSCIATGIVPKASDRILTLSTCSYEFDDARFVLLGILRESGF